ncbi:MAG: (d)CMP kinase [Planctomycetota bacterium]|nr:(d)CMP kinase [Planctomycetota bacterium]
MSDIHLHGAEPLGVARATRFVADAVENGTEALFLLGDIFKAWLGRRTLRDEGLAPFLEALREARAAGVRVVLLHGNHDFMMGECIRDGLGVEVHGRSMEIVLGGLRVRLSHGDEYCTDDLAYHRLHRVLRSKAFRGLIRRMPDRWAEKLAEKLNASSARVAAGKVAQTMSIVDDTVKRYLAGGSDVALCGHVHQARDEMIEGRRIVVMADFETTGSHAIWSGGELQLVPHDSRVLTGQPCVVTIDGPAGSGKSTVSRALADQLGYARLDSGALYRAVTFRAMKAGVNPDDEEGLVRLISTLAISVALDGAVFVDGDVIEESDLRSQAVSQAVSTVSAHAGVRKALVTVQRGAVDGHPGLVAEGRDMATIVFPDALLQFYLDAPLEVRAARRLAQEEGDGADHDAVKEALRERDEQDSKRETAPLLQAPAAIAVNTGGRSEEEVVAELRDTFVQELHKWAAEGR